MERCTIQEQPGFKIWEKAAAAFAPPSPHKWDVFISHAGKRADKPFARALKELLERCWGDIRIFLDDPSLVPGSDALSAMQAAMESTHVAVLLLSTEFFCRSATKHELALLLDRHREHRVQLLPVFLRLTVEDCQREMSTLCGPGAHALPPRILESWEPQMMFCIGEALTKYSGRRLSKAAHRHPPPWRAQQASARHGQDGT